MASTTSTEQSGLFAHLLPLFKQASGIDLRVVAVGTGQALDTARRGDADVVFVHDTVAEDKFVAEGFAKKRVPVMYNDFVLVGPASDPARARGQDIAAALGKQWLAPLHRPLLLLCLSAKHLHGSYPSSKKLRVTSPVVQAPPKGQECCGVLLRRPKADRASDGDGLQARRLSECRLHPIRGRIRPIPG